MLLCSRNRLFDCEMVLVVDDRQDVVLTKDDERVVVELDFRATVFPVENFVADFDGHLAACAGVQKLARTGRDHDTALRLLASGIGKNDSTGRGFVGLDRFEEYAIVRRAKLDFRFLCRCSCHDYFVSVLLHDFAGWLSRRLVFCL